MGSAAVAEMTGEPLFRTKALQFDAELEVFIALLKRENVRSYLEVGSKYGGSLWRIANALPVGSRIVSIDLPLGDTRQHLDCCARGLFDLGYEVHSFYGDSTSPEIALKVARLAPFDAILIDANHTLPYVTADWNQYGPLGRIIAFHDIAWRRPPDWRGGYRIDVAQFWSSIKGGYRHEEIKLDPTGQDNGFGVLWRA